MRKTKANNPSSRQVGKSQHSPRSLPLSIIGISLEELLSTGILPDSSSEIESQFRGIAALNVPPISQTTVFQVAQTMQSEPKQQRSSPVRVSGGNPYTLKH